MSKSLAEVQKENEDLKVQISTLKKKLGINDDEKTAALNLKASFDLFDRDRDGFITKNEFELLAFECGTDVSALTPENLGKVIAAINPKGDGKISFDDFQKWLQSKPAAAGDAKGTNLGPLKYKLQSKAFLAKVETLRAAAPKADGKDAKDAKDSKSDMKLFNLSLGVGNFQQAKASIAISLGENVELAAASRTAVSAPAESKFFLYVDLALQENFDESKVGELCGMIDALINTVPWNAFPVPVYASHSVDVAEVSGKKFLRITIFSAFDPEELVAPFLAASPTPLKVSEVLSGNIKLELPFSLGDIKNPNFRFNPEVLKARLNVSVDVNRKLKAVFQAMGQQPQFPKQVQLAALAFFVKGVDLGVTFAGIEELLANIPDGARNPSGEMKAALSQVFEAPIGAMIGPMVGQLPELAQSVGQKALYDNVKASVVGLSTVHVQLGNFVVQVKLDGINFLSLLP